MKVCILGAGLTGLAAALRLAGKFEVVIFEKNEVPGGCLASKNYGNYTLEILYHHCFSGDNELFELLETLSLKDDLIWLKGSTGYYMGGKLHPLTTPLEILKYPCLTLMQKAKLGVFVLSSRRIDVDALDTITARDYLVAKVGEEIYNAFFVPLLKSKFGPMKDDVSAAWLMSRIAIRSDRGAQGERLGYLKGGWHLLIDAVVERLKNSGVEIRLNTPATQIQKSNDTWTVNGEEFDVVLSTLPPDITRDLLDDPNLVALPEVVYQSAGCMTLGLNSDPTNGIYWTNMGDEAPYGAVVTHTNFVPFEWYKEHVVYLASYFKGEPENNLKEKMLDDFCSRFSIDRNAIRYAELYIDKYAGPVYITGYKQNIPKIHVGDNFYIAGMFSKENYPERSMEGSVRAGNLAAAEILGDK